MGRESAQALSEAEAEELHRDLVALLEEVEGAVADTRDGVKPVDLDEPIGRISRIDAIAQQKMNQAGRQGMIVRVQQARAALGRFEDGTYGECASCEESIGYARLKARPETPFCIECQSRREQAR